MRIVVENYSIWEVREDDELIASFTTRAFAEEYVKLMEDRIKKVNEGRDVIHG